MEEPEAVHPFDNSVSGGSGFELNHHKLSCERPSAEVELCTSTNMTENAVNKVQQASYYCSVIKNDNVVDEKVGVDETFNLQISHEQHAGHDPTSEADKVSNFEDISLCKEFILSDVRMQKCLIKSATFPSSEVDSLNFFNLGINGSSSCSSAPVQNSSYDQLPTYKRSTSLPRELFRKVLNQRGIASSKLVSAMKGGRKQNETSPRVDMRVKWAQDVYDPPATSMSHTVKSYNIQRPKSKKKDNRRQKHSKGKNSRGNNTGKKIPNRGNVGSISAPFPAKLQTGGANGPATPSEDILEFGVGGLHDMKCGSSIFLRESLAKMHLSFGEAT
ncbi:hypothetical protein MA16_Dca002956 [Dendrobium catenatum]|uniref:Uncharacterized protein n=1 Tax=Dendrobium catenatum TaxID=906689 RepID=A0A2I0X952_9ASPA|nr:hypothetical protein MA16_Dca002956 [Dendrobium catenatum]